jgi:TonB family protein
MFANLVESASHQKELKRRGRFLLATLAGYALVVMCLGVVSIYAYDTHLENQNLEFITLVNPDLVEQRAPDTKRAGPKSSTNPSESNTKAQRTDLIDRVDISTKVPDKISSVATTVPPIPHSGGVEIGTMNTEGTFNGPSGIKDSDGGSDNGGNGSVVKIDNPPPPLKEKPEITPQPVKLIRTSVLLNSKATYLPTPAYPQMAKIGHIQGLVNVQITIDEAGRVISARATSGNPVLQNTAVQAAYQARFTPTTLNGVAVKVTGMINFNFALN